LQVSDFYYELPEELIAQQPPAERGSSRMLVVSRDRGEFHDDQFPNFAQYIRPGDCLVLNDTRVFPARLHGRRNHTAGAAVEVFLIRPAGVENVWHALVKPGKRAHVGDRILFAPEFSGEIVEDGEFGERVIRFDTPRPIEEVIDQFGETPLPPYIHRKPDDADRERYQTVFARHRGSIAAPTAGLHFTPEILDQVRARGAEIAYVTLHVGLGTFAPLRQSDVSKIELHEESFELKESECEKMRAARRIICCGTTTVRTLETAMLRSGLHAQQGETNLFIHPGFHFRATGAMLTNFHLPESSLLMLVSAFGGRELILRAYQHAVRERYRFFSYGDCMFIA
jgi:S-adenosylmethionine:tRNA ribosyltransferase-isomerase